MAVHIMKEVAPILFAPEDINTPILDAFVEAYVTAMMFSTNDEADESGGEPLDKNYSFGDLALETQTRIRQDCADFIYQACTQAANEQEIEMIVAEIEHAGHDFWFTRCGHGVGFWDGDWPEAMGQRLTRLSQKFGEQWPYVGDDGNIYL